MLKAIVRGETILTSKDVLERYHLGNLNTIVRNKIVLLEQSFIESENGTLSTSDPVFLLWYQKQ